MKLLYSIFVLLITYVNAFLVIDNDQDHYLIENSQIIFYKKVYKRHTHFALEKMDNTKKSDFGQTFPFSPLDDVCDTNWEKNNAKSCFEYHPNNWNCIYENCISLSRTIPHYINIILPPIYYNNETTKQCILLS